MYKRQVFKDGKVTEYSCGNFEDAGAAGAAGNDKSAEAVGTDKDAGAAGNDKDLSLIHI